MSDELLARIETKLDALTTKVDDRIAQDDARHERHARILYGANGKKDSPGLLVRIDRLEQTQGRQNWVIRIVLGALVTLVVGGVLSGVLG